MFLGVSNAGHVYPLKTVVTTRATCCDATKNFPFFPHRIFSQFYDYSLKHTHRSVFEIQIQSECYILYVLGYNDLQFGIHVTHFTGRVCLIFHESTLKTVEARSSETSVLFSKTTRRHTL